MRRGDVLILVAVGAGSLAGGLCRYLVSLPWAGQGSDGFPWPTLLANVVGCGLIGFWFALCAAGGGWYTSPRVQAAVMSGFCGGLTTFSIFSLETLTLLESDAWMLAVIYVMASLVLWLFAAWAGFIAGCHLLDRRTLEKPCK